MKMFIALAGTVTVGVVAFFVYVAWFNTDNRPGRARSAHRVMVRAGTRFETARQNLYDTLGLAYEPGVDDQPQRGAIGAATREAAGGPKAKAVDKALDRYEIARRQQNEAIGKYHELGTAETDRAYGVPQ